MFRTVPLSIIRSFSLHTQQWYMSYRFADSLRAISKPVWRIPLLCVQWKTPDDGQNNCPKHVKFYSKKKLEKLVRLVLKIKIHRIIILPVVLYGYETWSLTLREGRKFENMVLRRIFGTRRDEVTGEWRRLHNEVICTPHPILCGW